MTPPTTLLACGGLTTKPVVVKNVVPFKKSLLKQLFQKPGWKPPMEIGMMVRKFCFDCNHLDDLEIEPLDKHLIFT